MPIFRLQVFKQIAGSDREWSNTYLVSASSMAVAVDAATAIATAEAPLYLDNVTITRSRASDIVPGTDVFTTTTHGFVGSRGTGADGDWLPLFNTFRADLNVNGGGRPSRKYYRLPFLEVEQQAGFIVPVTLSTLTGIVNDIIAAANDSGATLVDPDSQLITTAVGISRVQMRQLHRKRRKAAVSP